MQKPVKKNIPKKKEAVKRQSNGWKYLVLLVSAFVLYGNSIQHEFSLDDDIYFVKHASVQKGIKGIKEIFSEGSMKGFEGTTSEPTYRPVTLVTFAVEKQVSGNNPHTAHFINVLIYAIICLVLFRWLIKLFPGVHPMIILVISLLFMAHPVHTEVVASVKSRDELLAALFGILAMSLMMDIKPGNWFGKNTIIGSVVFLMALMSKESAITLTVMFPIILYILRKDTIIDCIKKSMPFIIVSGIFLFIRHMAVPEAVGETKVLIINNVLYGINDFATSIATKLEILFVYLRLVVLPYNLSWDYSYNQVPIMTWTDPLVWISLIIHLGLLILSIIWIRKKPIYSFSILFYFVTFSLTNNIFYPIRSTVGERFLLIPSLGFITAIVFMACEFLKLDTKTFAGVNRKIFFYGAGAIAIIYSYMTISRNEDWKSNSTLFEAGIRTSPNSARAQGAMASEYRIRGEQSASTIDRAENYKTAIEYYKKSLEILPSYNYSSYNMGVTYYQMGDTANSLTAFKLTLKDSPKYRDAIYNLGILYSLKQMNDSSAYFLEMLKEYYPDDLFGASNLAIIYRNLGNYEKALENADIAIQLELENPKNYRSKAEILHAQGKEEEAQRYLQLANERER